MRIVFGTCEEAEALIENTERACSSSQKGPSQLVATKNSLAARRQFKSLSQPYSYSITVQL